MKAYYLVRFGEPAMAFELREVPVPLPGKGQVRIRVQAFGLNYADVMARQGLYRGCPPLPCVLGYDVEGVIDEVGDGVSEFRTGDSVFALCRFGGYAEYVVTTALAVGHMPEGSPTGHGCAVAVQGVTAYHSAIHVQTLMPGEKVLIHAAAGGLGTSLIQIAHAKGCEVIGVVGGNEKVRYLQSLGVAHIIDHHEGDYIEYVHKFLKGKVDVVFDNIGGSSVKKAKSILAPGGRIISLGAAALSGKHGKLNLIRLALGFGFFSPIPFLGKSQAYIGVNMLKLADDRPDMIAAAFKGTQQLIEEGILAPHVGKIFPHAELAAAHQFITDRKAIGKVVVKWS